MIQVDDICPRLRCSCGQHGVTIILLPSSSTDGRFWLRSGLDFEVGSFFELNHQRRLLPNGKGTLPRQPILTFWQQALKVKAEKDPGHDKAHFGIGQVFADAIARPVAEGLESGHVVLGEPGLVQRMAWGQESLWPEFICLNKVVGVVVRGELEDLYDCLNGTVFDIGLVYASFFSGDRGARAIFK